MSSNIFLWGNGGERGGQFNFFESQLLAGLYICACECVVNGNSNFGAHHSHPRDILTLPM